MYFKLSLKNVRKSFKDYALYFLTLTFSVCIFYIFNSIEAQRAMMNISSSTNEMLKSITKIMSMLSIFVSFVLGFLIVYANNFLIRRRKKEIGIYMTLGMDKGKVAKLLVAETFLIGILSLGTGLVCGIFLSQSLSVVTAKLFEVDMTSYRFIFSPDGFFKTILYFGIIFIIVMLMSTLSITKFKLINLLNADKQNEQQRIRKPIITVILFILSLAFLITAYLMVMKNGLKMINQSLLIEILLGSIGTFLFYASLSGFFLKMLQSNKKSYYKDLNMFVLRQINSKITTTHISMSFICLMLFFTISILSTGLSVNSALSSGYSSSTPYDASFWITGYDNISHSLSKHNININEYADKAVQFSLYSPLSQKLTQGSILNKTADTDTIKTYKYIINRPLHLIKLTDYNKLMKLQHRAEVVMPEDEVAIFSDSTDSIPQIKTAILDYIKLKYPITLGDKAYKVYSLPLLAGLITSPANGMFLSLVVPDKLVDGATVYQTILSLNVKGDSRITEQKLSDKVTAMVDTNKKSPFDIRFTTKEEVKSIAVGSKAIIAFVGIYLGIIFMIASAAILALQQLSEATDNKRRYEIIRKVGADESLINSTLFKQIAIYFMLPLSLAIVHSIVAIKVVSDSIQSAGHVNLLGNITITAALITLVYGAYFLATYFSSKRII